MDLKICIALLVLGLSLAAAADGKRWKNKPRGRNGRDQRNKMKNHGVIRFFMKFCQNEDVQNSTICGAYDNCEDSGEEISGCVLNWCTDGKGSFFCDAVKCHTSKGELKDCHMGECQPDDIADHGEAKLCKMMKFHDQMKACREKKEGNTVDRKSCLDDYCKLDDAYEEGCNKAKFWMGFRACRHGNPADRKDCIKDLCAPMKNVDDNQATWQARVCRRFQE